ncbi:uncharacterized protein [Asterias amurensis]|uniref:uncharacterized protein isoform X2 n=1 Tax=Asterias amurensis TaxID=7602 RepID=UPI003AB212BC
MDHGQCNKPEPAMALLLILDAHNHGNPRPIRSYSVSDSGSEALKTLQGELKMYKKQEAHNERPCSSSWMPITMVTQDP